MRRANDGRSEPWFAKWESLLEGPLDQVVRMLVEDSVEARALRQSSPFAGALTARERTAVLVGLRERCDAP